MKQLPYICLHRRYYSTLAMLNDSQKGRLFWALLEYNENRTEPVLKGRCAVLWPMLRDQYLHEVETYTRRSEVNRENGKKGGRPKKAKKSEGLFSKPKKTIEKEKEKEIEKENENEREIETDTNGVCVSSVPDIEEIRQYCFDKCYNLDAELFFNYYEGKGWRLGGEPIHNWKAVLDNWMKRDIPHGRPYGLNGAYMLQRLQEDPGCLDALSEEERYRTIQKWLWTPPAEEED